MKKKLVAALMSVCLVATLSGCFNFGQVMDGDGMVNEDGGNGGNGGVQQSTDWDLSLMPNNNNNGGEASETAAVQNEGAILNDTNNRVLLIVDEDGNLVKSVDYKDIFDVENGGVIGTVGDYIFYTQYLPGDYEHAEIHRYNFNTAQGDLVAASAASDYYNYYAADPNTLYHFSVIYNDDKTVYECQKYECRDGNWSLVDSGYSAFFDKASDYYDLVWNGNKYMTPYTENGPILVREKDGNRYLYVDKEGNGVTDTIYLCENGGIVAVDENVIIYNEYGDDYSTNETRVYNVSDGKSKSITTKGVQIKYDNGRFFYYVTTDKKVYYSYDVHMYDVASGVDKIIYSKTKSPYFQFTSPGLDFFNVAGNNVFYHDIDDKGNLIWRCTDLTKANPDKDLLVVTENKIKDYGYLEVLDNAYYCPECGAVDYTLADAYLVYDGDEATPEATAKINNTLKADAEGAVQEDDGYSLAGECEYMHPNYVCTGETSTLDVWVINNKYLSIETSNYYYYGGAHGGSFTGCRVFDLTTGDEVDPMDLYQGSKEEMAKIVANKVKEDYSSGNSQYGYFAENADGVYSESYDYVMEGYESIILTDKGVTVIFGEYSLGPYASGQFMYDFTYDELKFNVQ